MRRPSLSLSLLALLVACGSQPDATAKSAVDFTAIGIAHARTPAPGLYCSGQPTKEQFAQLRAAGVQRFVCLRPATEDGTGWEEQAGKDLGIDVRRIPITGANDLTTANVDLLRAATADGVPVLVACGSSNRVGALMALKARADGKSPDEALQWGKTCGLTKLEPQVKALLAK